ncbi:unnamed protein product [Rhizophagus irregularis]|nr:unnamed protein product [Rhizophagus irregularis]
MYEKNPFFCIIYISKNKYSFVSLQVYYGFALKGLSFGYFAFSLILHITMGLNILKFFSVLSIFLFVASAYHLAERAVVTCDHCAPVSGIGDCSSNSFTSISQWDCSGSTNAICTSLCTGCTLTCTSATSIAWTCNCT